MAVDLDEAFRRSVENFYEQNNSFAAYEKATGKPMKYNKPFFDRQEKYLRKKNRKDLSKGQETSMERDISPMTDGAGGDNGTD